MLRTNLSTRPFYNERVVRIGIAAAAVLVAALTAFNVREIVSLNSRSAESSRRADEAERQTAEFRREAQEIRRALSSVEMTTVQQAATEANQLIDRRVFSWTELFNEFERTLPPDVRITAVSPQFDSAGRMLIVVTALSRRPEDLSDFMDQLEVSGRFREVLNRSDQPESDGLTRSVLQGYYDASGQVPAATPPAASEAPEGANNGSGPAPAGQAPRPGSPQ